MKLALTVLINREVDLKTYLEDDERLEGEPFGEDAEDAIAVSEADLIERVRSAVDDGDESLDDWLNEGSDYTVTVEVASEQSTSLVWTEKLTQSQVGFVNSIVARIPETLGARKAFVECLQKLAEAK